MKGEGGHTAPRHGKPAQWWVWADGLVMWGVGMWRGDIGYGRPVADTGIPYSQLVGSPRSMWAVYYLLAEKPEVKSV